MFALTFLVGCVRFGYDAQHLPSDQPPDAQPNEAGPALTPDASTIDAGMDAAVIADPGSQMDASVHDASMPVVMAQDASTHVVDAGTGAAMDASMPQDTGVPEDSAIPVSLDSGSMPVDAATSSSGPCTFQVTSNQYVGNGHYHGTLLIKNTGTTTWTKPTVEFDLPGSSSNYCNDEDVLPGPGWALQSINAHSRTP
jgi:hypothetical protein